MSHATIVTGLWISLVAIFPIGVLVVHLWGKIAHRWSMKYIEDKKIRSGYAIALIQFIYVSPGILFMILACISALYFNQRFTQENAIFQAFMMKGLKKDSPVLDKYRGTYNIDEIYERVRKFEEQP